MKVCFVELSINMKSILWTIGLIQYMDCKSHGKDLNRKYTVIPEKAGHGIT